MMHVGLRSRRNRSGIAIVAAAVSVTCAALAPVDAMAASQTLYWDVNGASGGIGGTGTWSTGAANWSTSPSGNIATIAWDNTNSPPNDLDIATFNGTAGGTVTLGGAINALRLDFTAGNNYLISGAGGNALTLAAPDSTAGNILVGGTSNFYTATIDAQLTGSVALMKTGSAGTLVLTNGANNFTGNFQIGTGSVSGGTVWFSSIANAGVVSAIGQGSSLQLGRFSTLIYTGATASSDRVINLLELASRATTAIDSSGTGELTLSGGITQNNQGAAGRTNTIRLTGSTDAHISGAITPAAVNGDIEVAKQGSNTWTLSAANTYAGLTMVGGTGTLRFAGSGSALNSANYTASYASTLQLDNTAANSTNRLRDGATLILNGGTFEFLGSSAAASSESLGLLGVRGASAIGVTSGAGQSAELTFSSFSRDVLGILLIRGTGLGTSAAGSVPRIKFTNPAGVAHIGSTVVSSTGPGTVKNLRIAPSMYGDTGTGVGNSLVTYDTGTGLRPLDPVNELTQNSLTTGNNVRLTTDLSANSATINALVLDGGNLTLNGGQTLTVSSGGILFAGNQSISGGNGINFLNLEGIVNVVDGATATISTAIASSNANALTKGGPGTLVVDVTQTYTGKTNLVSGTLRSVGTSLQNSSIVLGGGSNATLDLNNANVTIGSLDGGSVLTSHAETSRAPGVVALGSATLTTGGDEKTTNYAGTFTGSGDVIKVGTGTMTLSGAVGSANLSTGTFYVNSGILQLGKDAGNDSIRAGLSIGDGSGVDTVKLTANDQINNTTGIVTVNGNGVFDVDIRSDSVSATNVLAGKVTVTGAGTLNPGLLTMAGGSIEGTGSLNVANAVTAANTADGSAAASISSKVLLGTANRSFTVTHNAGASASDLEITGVISSGASGAITKLGAGTMSLSGANTFTGGVNVNEGTVVVGGSSVGGPTITSGPLGTAAVNLGNTAGSADASLVFDTVAGQSVLNAITVRGGNSGTATLGGRNTSGVNTFAGNVTLGSGTNVAKSVTLTASAGGHVQFTGNLLKNGNSVAHVTKVGDGVATLGGTNTYTGTTTVNAGTLRVTGSLDALSAVSVNTGGTIAGDGDINGSLAINAGGTLSPGNSPGTLDAGNTAWSGAGNYNWQLADAEGSAGADWDVLAVTGTLDLTSASGFGINLWTLSSIAPDVNGDAVNFDGSQSYAWTIATTTGGVLNFDEADFVVRATAFNGTGGFTNAFGSGAFNLELANGDKDLVLTYSQVPEPGAISLTAVGLLGALARRRRGR